MGHGLLCHLFLLCSFIYQLFQLFPMVDSLLPLLLSFKFLKIGSLLDLLFDFLVALLSIKTGLFTRLVKLVAHLKPVL